MTFVSDIAIFMLKRDVKLQLTIMNDVISGFAKVVVERCGFHHCIALMISCGDVVSVFVYLFIVSDLWRHQ